MGATFALVFAGCSSGATSHLTPSSSGSGSSSQSKGRATVTGRIFIPGLTKATATAKYRSALSTRSPKYVSASTMGVAIKTETPAGVAIDNTAFSTNSSDNPNCTATTTPTPGTNCTFAVGALAPMTNFYVTAYSMEPSVPTGGATSTPNGTALSTATLSAQPITAGTTNAVNVALGGVVASYTLTYVSPTAPAPALSPTPSLANNTSFSLPANNTTQTVTIAIVAQDASSNMILSPTVAGGTITPYANAITIAEKETAGTHTTLSLTHDGQTTPAQSGATVASAYSGDTLTLTYDGLDAFSTADPGVTYYDSLTGTISSATDAYSGAAIAAPEYTTTFTLTPLMVYADSENGDSFTNLTAPPVFTFSIPPAAPATPSVLYATENGFIGGAPTYTLMAAPGNACMGVSFTSYPTPPTMTYPYGSFTFDQTTAATAPTNDTSPAVCTYDLSDGSSVLPITIYYNANPMAPMSKLRAAQPSSNAKSVIK